MKSPWNHHCLISEIPTSCCRDCRRSRSRVSRSWRCHGNPWVMAIESPMDWSYRYHIPLHPLPICWYIKTYKTGWVWTRANVSKYSVHGASGIYMKVSSIGLPPKHPLGFSILKHPAIGDPPIYGNSRIFIYILFCNGPGFEAFLEYLTKFFGLVSGLFFHSNGNWMNKLIENSPPETPPTSQMNVNPQEKPLAFLGDGTSESTHWSNELLIYIYWYILYIDTYYILIHIIYIWYMYYIYIYMYYIYMYYIYMYYIYIIYICMYYIYVLYIYIYVLYIYYIYIYIYIMITPWNKAVQL